MCASRRRTRSAPRLAPTSRAPSGSGTDAASTWRSVSAGCTNIAYTGRPITAAFAGAPAAAFTVYGATPQRDAAVIGFSARTAVSDNASVYLRYDGDIGSGTDNHAFNLGLRFSW